MTTAKRDTYTPETLLSGRRLVHNLLPPVAKLCRRPHNRLVRRAADAAAPSSHDAVRGALPVVERPGGLPDDAGARPAAPRRCPPSANG
ncbi:hypothetical protein STENM223S_02549 [Streptomyces tendae]